MAFAARKITIEVPEELLRDAQRATEEGVTATVRRGLELVAAQRASEGLRQLRGRIRFGRSAKELREDRR